MPDPTATTTRAQSFAGALNNMHHVTMLTVGGRSGIDSYLLTPDKPGADNAALNLAQSVSARADKIDEPPDLSATGTIGVMRADLRSSTASRSTQHGADASETARRIATSLRTGKGEDDSPGWIAASVRKSTQGERKRSRRWYSHRLGTQSPTHHVMDTNAVTVSFMAGGDDRHDVTQQLTQIASSLPGFDLEAKPHILRPRLAAIYPILAGAAATTALNLLGQPILFQILAAVICALAATGIITGAITTPTGKTVDRARAGRFAAPPRKLTNTKKPQKADDQKDAHPGDYPMHREAFLVGPSILVGLIAPHAGGASGQSVTERKSASTAMLNPDVGPTIGTAGDENADVHLSAPDLRTGLAAIGRPGSGKSVLIHSLYAWNCLERIHPSGRPGFPGEHNTLIAFESKGDGAAVYKKWAKELGDKTLLIDVADPDRYGIDIFDLPGSLPERVRLFTNMLVYAFADGSIQGQSYESLETTLTGALVIDPDIAETAGLPTEQSPIYYAYILLGGQGDSKGKALAKAIGDTIFERREQNIEVDDELVFADDQLSKIYAGVSESARRSHTQAARNKIGEMIAAESWWSPRRKKVTWRKIINEHRSVVINTGVSTRGHHMDERLSQYMASLLTYSMVETIKRNCNGWQEQGRSVSIFSDELSQMAGSSPETMTWLHDQGRSYGIHPYLATQRLQQLPGGLRSSLMDYSTVLWFSQSNPEAAAAAVADLSADGSEWSNHDITGLEPYTAIVRTYAGQMRQPAVPVKLAYFEADMASFPERQGYTTDQLGKTA